ncbi:MAG: tetratricopeptide repeat protein [Pirellulales bacterium]
MALNDFQRAFESAQQANRIRLTAEGLEIECYAYCRQEDGTDKAIEAGERYLRLFPANARVLNNLGRCYLEKRRFNDAQKVLDTACEMEPELLQARFNRASVELRRIQLTNHPPSDQSLADMRKVVAAPQKSGEPYLILVSLLSRLPKRAPVLLDEIRSLIKTGTKLGIPHGAMKSFAPRLPEVSVAEFGELLVKRDAPDTFKFDPFVAPF